MIGVKHGGSFNSLEKFLKEYNRQKLLSILDQCGQMGVDALSASTPIETGLASESWGYMVTTSKTGFGITWTNDDVEDGCNVIILIQYGHGTKNGGYVEGRDFINPAIQPIFDKIEQIMWEEVTKV